MADSGTVSYTHLDVYKRQHRTSNPPYPNDFKCGMIIAILYVNYSLLTVKGGIMDSYGIISLLPVTVVIVVALLTKRTVEPLIMGAVVGYVILYKAKFFTEILAGFTKIVSENAWFILVFGMFGIVAKLLEESGSALGCLLYTSTSS